MFYKIILPTLLVILVIIGGVMSSVSLLKEETIKTHQELSQLYSRTFTDQMSRLFKNIEQNIEDVDTIIQEQKIEKNISESMKILLRTNLHIRSINILNTQNKIIYSTNLKNLEKQINTDDFYPKPLFNKTILRIGKPWKGRDSVDGEIISQNSQVYNSHLSFIPVMKQKYINSMIYKIVINLNSDYITTNLKRSFSNDIGAVDFLRVDNTLLTTTDQKLLIGTKINSNQLLMDAKEYSESFGIIEYGHAKQIISYQLDKLYPFMISVRLDLKKSLKGWEKKKNTFLGITTTLVSLCALLILVLIIRDQKQKQKVLSIHKEELKNKEKFKILFEQNYFLIVTLNPNGTIIDINNNFMLLLNKEYKQLISNKIWDIFECSTTCKNTLQRLVENYSSNNKNLDEITILDFNNNKKILQIVLSAIQVEDSIELVLIAQDITEKKEKEDQLLQAYTVFDNAHDGIMITNENVEIINVNAAFEKATGYTLEESKFRNPSFLQSGLQSKEFYKNMWREINTVGYWEGEVINRNKQQEIYHIWLKINLVNSTDNKSMNYIGIFSDITKQRDQEEQIKEKEKILFQQSKMAAMGEMIANIAHQWRQPLSVISTSASGIKLKKEYDMLDDDFLDVTLDGIVDNTMYLSKTIDDFRDFFKTDKPKEIFKISSVVDKTINLIGIKFKNDEINIIKDIEDIEVESLQNELLQVVMNILNNSRDAISQCSNKEKYIFIKIYREKDQIILKITDNAGGIPEDIIDRIFEPYYTTKHQSQGTGIGLYMSQEIITKHIKGTIVASNVTFLHDNISYKGACFTVTIPST